MTILGGNPVEPSERTPEQQVADDRNDEETGVTKKIGSKKWDQA